MPTAGLGVGAGEGLGPSPPLSADWMKSIKSMNDTSRIHTRVSTTAVHRPRGPTRSSNWEGCTAQEREGKGGRGVSGH